MKVIHTLPAAALLALISGPALAHPDHAAGASFAAGLMHPFGGLDHLMVVVAVGVWAYQLGSRAVWLVPASFCAAMVAGFQLAHFAAEVPGAELFSALAVLILGLLVASGFKLRAALAAPLIGVFAFIHGIAHVPEVAHTVGGAYLAGLLLATAALHVAGVAGASILAARVRAAGMPLIICGTLLVARAVS